MAKRETKQTYKDTRQYAQGVSGQYQPLAQQSQQRTTGYNPNPQMGADRQGLQTQYTNLSQGMGGIPQVSAHTIGNVGATDVSDLKNAIEGYKAFRDTGGLSQENIDRMRGNGMFDEYAKTGGYTDKNLADIKAQAISPIGSFATGARDELARRQAVQGGYGPGMDAASRAIRRDAARGITDASLNANVMLKDRVNQGRQWGISGLAGAEAGLATLQTGNRLAALGGETNAGSSISQASAADRANELAVQQFNAMAQNSTDQFNTGNTIGGMYAGMGGLQGLYNMDNANQQTEYDRGINIANAENAARGNYLGTQTQTAVQPGWGGNLVGALGAAGGIASQFFAPGMSGMGSLGTYSSGYGPGGLALG